MSTRHTDDYFEAQLRAFLDDRAESVAAAGADASEMFERVRRRTESRRSVELLRLAIVVGALIAVGVGGLLAIGSLPRPPQPVANGPIGFVSGGRVLVFDPDGTTHDDGPVPQGGSCCTTAWSPDGRRLLIGTDSSVVLIGADRSSRRDLISGERVDGAPSWSPTGKAIAVSLAVGATTQIVVIDIDTGRRSQVSHASQYARWPSYAPDGSRIAFVAHRPEAGSGEALYVVAPDGSGERLVYDLGLLIGSLVADRAWSPDGIRVAITQQLKQFRPQPLASVVVVRPETSTQKSLEAVPRDGFDAAWSPDGFHVAFFSRSADGSQDLWIVNGDGTAARKLAEGVDEFNWSPDGQRLVIAGERVGDALNRVSTMGTDGNDPHDLSITGVVGHLAWGPATP